MKCHFSIKVEFLLIITGLFINTWKWKNNEWAHRLFIKMLMMSCPIHKLALHFTSAKHCLCWWVLKVNCTLTHDFLRTANLSPWTVITVTPVNQSYSVRSLAGRPCRQGRRAAAGAIGQEVFLFRLEAVHPLLSDGEY